MDEVEIVRNVEDAGFVAKRRNMHYEILGDPMFRLRDVPRMLELATARTDGDTSVPVELLNYPARSAAGKRQRRVRPDQSRAMIAYRAAWVCPIASPPIRDGWFAVRRRTHRRALARRANRRRSARAISDGRRAARPRQCAHASRAVRTCAIVCRQPPISSSWVKQLDRDSRRTRRAAGRSAGDRRRAERRARGARERNDRGRRHQQLAGVGRPDARFRAARRRVSRAARVRRGRRPSDRREPAGERSDAAARVADACACRCVRTRRTRCPRRCFVRSASDVDRSGVPITSVHLGESVSEIEMLADGSGPWPGMLRFIGKMPADWTPPRTGPVEYLDSLGMLDARTLVVHGVQLQTPALERLAAIGLYARHVSAKQSVGRRRRAADRALLCLRRPRRRRHRQPRERCRSEPVLRTEDDALAGAGGAGAPPARERDDRRCTGARAGRGPRND